MICEASFFFFPVSQSLVMPSHSQDSQISHLASGTLEKEKLLLHIPHSWQ